MKTISMECPFSEGNFVSKQSFYGLDYGTKIDVPSEADVLVEEVSKRRRYQLSRSASNILNPKPKGTFFKKNDPESYVIYFISHAFIDGVFQSNVKVKNPSIQELDYETIFYEGKYRFKVTNGEQFLKFFVSENLNQFSRDYFRNKIKGLIEPVIKEAISSAITKYGLSNFYSKISSTLINDLNDKLSEGSLWDAGIELRIVSLDINEEKLIATLKREKELESYNARKDKEGK